jgi:uncharacterized protein
MTEAFAANLKAKLDELATQRVEDIAAMSAETGVIHEPEITAPAAAAAPLNLGNMFWSIVWSRLKRVFGIARSHEARADHDGA